MIKTLPLFFKKVELTIFTESELSSKSVEMGISTQIVLAGFSEPPIFLLPFY